MTNFPQTRMIATRWHTFWTRVVAICLYFFATVLLRVLMEGGQRLQLLWLIIGSVVATAYGFYLVRSGAIESPVMGVISIALVISQFMALWQCLAQGTRWLILFPAVALLVGTIAGAMGSSPPMAHEPDLPGTDPQATPAQHRRQESYATGARQLRTERRFPVKISRRTFNHIHGMDDVKARLKTAAHAIVHSAGPGRVRNGILLFGEPGNGKTVFVEALAGELGLPYLTVTYGDVASRWINETTENVVQVFRDAVAQAPCVLFFDEIDSLVKQRHDRNSFDESPKITNSILTELVNARDRGVIIVGATNHFDQLDAAAIREGRFDYKIEVPPPDALARYGILLQALEWNLPAVPFDWDSVRRTSKRWDGFSVKRIFAVVEELAQLHAERPIEMIDTAEFLRALRRVQGRKGQIPATTKRVAELILSPALRRQLETIAVRMRDIDRVERLGGTVPAGLLFFGAPGTGKTETARALAKESGWAFLSTSGNELLRDPGEIDRLIAEAKDIRPCIVFIDEADDVLANRTEASQTVSATNKLLAVMDGAYGKAGDVLFIAATNHPDRIDPAALRGGRFTEKLSFPLPDQDGLQAFVKDWIEQCRAPFDIDLTPEVIESHIGQVSIANAAAILQEAVNQMIGCMQGADDDVVRLGDILSARKAILGG